MLVRKPAIVAMAALLALAVLLGCFRPSVAQAQAKDCCAQLDCARGHQKQICFSTTAPAGSFLSAPESRALVGAPLLAVSVQAPLKSRRGTFSVRGGATDAPQHSPPELYTLHSSLLI